MVEVTTLAIPTTATAPDHTSQREPHGLAERANATATRVGNNIDLINLYARQKDWYKIFEVVGAVSSRFFASAGAKLFGREHVSIKELENNFERALERNPNLPVAEYHALQKEVAKEKSHASKVAGLSADSFNTALQLGISSFSNWWEKQTLVRVYDKALQQEFGIEHASYADLKRSKNPIIHNAADYYNRKAIWRTAPDLLGLIKWVPEVAKMIGGPNGKAYKATEWIEKSHFSGIDLALGGKTAYFLWYFIERQTGGHYALLRIWNKTEGVKDSQNRLVNQNVHPGDLVSQEEITGLYREVAQDRKLRDFTTDDPLTGRMFEQIARYLNHHYVPELYKVKRPAVDHTELQGSHFTHADLVTLLGTEGIDINDVYATALRIEVAARKGYKDYIQVNELIHNIKRPSEKEYTDKVAYGNAFHDYVGKLDEVAKSTLGDQWPAKYIREDIRPNMFISHGLQPEPVDAPALPEPAPVVAHPAPQHFQSTAINPAAASQSQSEPGYYQQLVSHTPPAGGASSREAGGSLASSILAERDPARSHSERAETAPAQAAGAARI